MFPASCGNQKTKTYTVGVINVTPSLDPTLEGFKAGMTELGYIEGKTIRYIYDGPTTDMGNLPAAARALTEAKADLILSITTPATKAAKQATRSSRLPVVFAVVTDPVGGDIVETIQHPGGNITGVAFGIAEARRLEWLLRIAPRIRQIYVPYNPKDKSPVLALKMVRKAAEKLGVKLITREVNDPETLDDAVTNIPAQADAVFHLPDSLIGTRLSDLTAAAGKRNLPISAANILDVKNYNMLTGYGFDQHLCGRQAARLVDQIFKGTRPMDLPVETAEFYLAINLKIAKSIGLDISEEILRQADIIVR
ncbi:MAG: ABC transporter substrate-binding protein [Pseudomonadota bacterium]